MSGSPVEYSMAGRSKGATDENRHEATEARQGGIDGALGVTAVVGGGPDPRAPLGQAGARHTRPWEQPSVGTYDLTRLVGTTLPVARATGRTQLETVASVLATPSRSACRWWCRGYRNRWPSVAEDPFYCTAQRTSNDAAAACWLGTVSPCLQLAPALAFGPID